MWNVEWNNKRVGAVVQYKDLVILRSEEMKSLEVEVDKRVTCPFGIIEQHTYIIK